MPKSPTSSQLPIPDEAEDPDNQPNDILSSQPSALEIIPDSEGEEELLEITIPSEEPTRAIANGAPKTMQELAEAAEREQADKDRNKLSEDEDEVEDISVSNIVAQRAIEKTNGKSTPSPRGRTRKGARTATASKPKTTPKKPANGRASTRSRKRAREEVDSEEDQAANEEREEENVPTPSKRARSRAAPTTPVVEKSDRVLRSRRGKSEAKIVEEKEMEKAYRRAIAE